MQDVPRSGPAAPLVGRARELRVLRDALDRAGRGEPGAVLVAGDAGVGKTRLLAELAARAEQSGATVLVGRCLDVGGVGLPYLPFTEALRGLPEPAAAHLSGWREGLGAGGEVGQLQLFDAVAAALAEAGRGAAGPVLLVLEDLHWADQSSRDLLLFLLGRLRDERLLVVASYRSDDLHRRHPLRPLLAQLARVDVVERLDLRPFDAAELADYVRGLGAVLDERAVQELLARSEGNAYYAQELLSARGAPGGRPLPADLAEVLLARLDGLGEEATSIARVAAVAGRRVGHDLLAHATGLAPVQVEAGVREAVAQLVLVADGDAYAFRHALLAEAVYDDLLPGERVRLHATYARLIASHGDGPVALGSAAELAHHRLASHDLPGALTASLRAADEAEGFAPAEAWQHLEQVLQLWEAVEDAAGLTGTDLAALGLRAARLAGRAGEMGRAVQLAEAAVQQLDPEADPQRAAEAQHKLAVHLLNADRSAAGLGAATEALRLAGDRPSATGAGAAATAARALRALDREDEARELAERARDEAQRTGSADAEADALVTLAALDAAAGRTDAAARQLALARDRAQAAGDLTTELRVSYALAVDRYDEGALPEALALLDDAVARTERTGLSWSVYGLELRALRVTARYVAGDWDGSAQDARLSGPRAPAPAVARLAATSLYVAVGRGEPRAADLLAQLKGTWPRDAAIALVAGGCGAELLTWQGRPEQAVPYASRAMQEVARAWEEPWFLGGIRLAALGLAAVAELAERARVTGDARAEQEACGSGERLVEHARTTAQRGHPRGGALGPEGRAWVLRAEAEHARVRGEPDVALWQRTVEAYAYGPGSVHVYEQARARLQLAAGLLAHDRRDEAAEQARAVLEVARALGAAPLRGAVTALARRGRLALADGAAPPPAAAVLTPRESEVLRLLAAGRTNRQIGAELFIAEKTASVHVSNILAKLGASGRAEAVDVAHRAGLLPVRGA